MERPASRPQRARGSRVVFSFAVTDTEDHIAGTQLRTASQGGGSEGVDGHWLAGVWAVLPNL